MRTGFVLAGLASLILACPAQAASGFVQVIAPHGFAVAHPAHAPMVAEHARDHFRAFDGAAALETLDTGSFESANAGAYPPPYPPPGYYPIPAYYTPPPSCFRPLLIHLTAEPEHKVKLPRIVYGTAPPVCPQEYP